MPGSEDFAREAAELRWAWINAEDSAERQRLLAMVADLRARQLARLANLRRRRQPTSRLPAQPAQLPPCDLLDDDDGEAGELIREEYQPAAGAKYQPGDTVIMRSLNGDLLGVVQEVFGGYRLAVAVELFGQPGPVLVDPQHIRGHLPA